MLSGGRRRGVEKWGYRTENKNSHLSTKNSEKQPRKSTPTELNSVRLLNYHLPTTTFDWIEGNVNYSYCRTPPDPQYKTLMGHRLAMCMLLKWKNNKGSGRHDGLMTIHQAMGRATTIGWGMENRIYFGRNQQPIHSISK